MKIQGYEPPEFWYAMGGKQDYLREKKHKTEKDTLPPRLFQVVSLKGNCKRKYYPSKWHRTINKKINKFQSKKSTTFLRTIWILRTSLSLTPTPQYTFGTANPFQRLKGLTNCKSSTAIWVPILKTGLKICQYIRYSKDVNQHPL